MKKTPPYRRKFIQQAAAVSLGFMGLQSCIWEGCQQVSKSKKIISNFPYGNLQPDPNGLLNLPKGFNYKIISRVGDVMSDGFFTPNRPDGMATFDGGDGKVIVIRNHELMPSDFGPFGKNDELFSKIDKSKMYDAASGRNMCKGGTTTFIYNEKKQKIESSWLSLAGTLRNCAGGLTPWGSWVTCEEIFIGTEKGYQKNHGYSFEVPVTSKPQLADPIPLKDMGRFNHEAICVDPKTGIVYETEDQHESLIYRFLPNEKGNLKAGGKLQALVVKGQKSMDTRNWDKEDMPLNEAVEVEWIDLTNVDTGVDDLRYRYHKKGAARFARGEGMWFGDNELFFACTSGGKTKTGQVFRYIPSPYEGTPREPEQPGKLELYLEPNDKKILKYCDNLTIAPWGDVVLCEDNHHPRIVGVTSSGELYKLAENVGAESEFAGGVFSPSGKIFFVNIQHSGLTIAIGTLGTEIRISGEK